MSDETYKFSSGAAEAAAAEAGLSLADFAPGGSGSGGNVTKADVEAKVEAGASSGSTGETTGAPNSPSEEEAKEPDARQPVPDPGPQNPPPGDADHMPDAQLETAEPVGLPIDALPMRERDHVEGCPADEARIEAYKVTRPKKVDNDGIVVEPAKRVTVTRCVDCGGQRVAD